MSDFKPYLDELRESLNSSVNEIPDDDRDKVFHVRCNSIFRIVAKDKVDAKEKFIERIKKGDFDDLRFTVMFVRYDDSSFMKRAMASSGESCMIDQGITQGIV